MPGIKVVEVGRVHSTAHPVPVTDVQRSIAASTADTVAPSRGLAEATTEDLVAVHDMSGNPMPAIPDPPVIQELIKEAQEMGLYDKPEATRAVPDVLPEEWGVPVEAVPEAVVGIDENGLQERIDKHMDEMRAAIAEAVPGSVPETIPEAVFAPGALGVGISWPTAKVVVLVSVDVPLHAVSIKAIRRAENHPLVLSMLDVDGGSVYTLNVAGGDGDPFRFPVPLSNDVRSVEVRPAMTPPGEIAWDSEVIVTFNIDTVDEKLPEPVSFGEEAEAAVAEVIDGVLDLSAEVETEEG